MRPRPFMILAALVAGLILVTTPPAAEAQTAKDCKNDCKDQKKACVDGFKAQKDAATDACAGDKQCKKDAKQAFKTNKKSCTKDADGFKTCKDCCKGDDLASCGIKICGDGQTVAPEECDDGANNSDTAPDACRTTCQDAGCGDGVLDSGEECDDGANNSDTAANACRATCQAASCGDGVQDAGEGCDDGPNNSDTVPDACRTTCFRGRCGDNLADFGEECDGTSDAACPDDCRRNCTCTPVTCGDNTIQTGEDCDGTQEAACACTGSCQDDCLCFDFTRLAFTTVAPGGSCGRVNTDPAGTGTDLTPYGATSSALQCGTLYIGGGGSAQPPSPTPDGATSKFNIVCGDPTNLTLAATTSSETGSRQSCTSPGCFFGPPLPIPNSGQPAVSTCVINSIALSPPASGKLDATTGMATTTLPLTVLVRVTGDLQTNDPGIQPCPTCTDGTCDSGANSGGACGTTTSLLTSHDCLPAQMPLAPFGVNLSPLATGNALKTAAGNGNFCGPTPGQRSLGAFGNPTANYIQTQGSPAGDLTSGQSLAATQSSVFCIPASGSALVDSVADLAGPGAVTLKGSSSLE